MEVDDDSVMPNYENVMVSQPGQQVGQGPSVELMPVIQEQAVAGSVQPEYEDVTGLVMTAHKKKFITYKKRQQRKNADKEIAMQETFDSRSPRKK